MTLSEIRLRLQELGIRPSRRLGQNFLHDQNLARRIVEIAAVQPEDFVLEIGPGLGALTEFLLEQKPQLTLIEKDPRLAAFLQARFPKVRLIEGDALEKVDLFRSQLSNFVVLGNLPYSIASPLIVRLCESDLRPRRMLFTIQLEAAERLVAHPRTHDFGLLTLLTQAFYEIKIVRRIPPSVFWPQPEVESALVSMMRREVPSLPDEASESKFRRLAKQAFQKRRKTLGSIFGKDLPPEINRNRRPEELTLQEWIRFGVKDCGESSSASPKAVEDSGDEIFDVVNDRDEVEDQAKRRDVHQNGLFHRAVHIFIWNSKGELLLQKRSAIKDVAPNTWDSSAAGHLASGEDYDTAARREIVEELGAPSIPLQRIRKFQVCEELGWEFVWLYEGRFEGPFNFCPTEISELRWWKTREITAAIQKHPSRFAPSFRHLWKQLKVSP